MKNIKKCTGILLFNNKKEVLLIKPNHPIKVNNIYEIPYDLIDDNDYLNSAKKILKEKTNIELNENYNFINLGEETLHYDLFDMKILIYSTEFNDEYEFKTQNIKFTINNKEYNIPEIKDFKWLKIADAKRLIKESDIIFIERLENFFNKKNKSNSEKRFIYENFLNETKKVNESFGVNDNVLEWSDFLYSILENEIFLFAKDLENKEYFKQTIFIQAGKKTNSVSINITSKDIDFYKKYEKLTNPNFLKELTFNIDISFISLNDFNFDVELSNGFFDETDKLLYLDIYLPDDFISEKNKTEETFKKFISKYFNNYLKSLITHELTHALEFTEKVKKKINHVTKEILINHLNNSLKNNSKYHISKDLDDFLKLIYLNLSFEINARIAQLYTIIEKKDIKNQTDFWKEVKKSEVWKEMITLKNFDAEKFYFNLKFENLNNIKELENIFKNFKDSERKQLLLYGFLKNWNNYIQLINKEYKDENIKLKNIPEIFLKNPLLFFKQYEKKFKNSWNYFYDKVDKLFSKFI